MQIYNSRNIDHKHRFYLAIIASFFAAIGVGIAYGIITRVLMIESAIFYVFMGFCIGYVVRYVGHGVHQRFAVLGAAMTCLAIFFGDILVWVGMESFFAFLTNPTLWGAFFQAWLADLLQVDLRSILSLILRVIGIYFAYHYSRIL